MFIGHYAVGLAAKKWSPKTSLGTLLAAALWANILWPFFTLLDLEHFRVVPGFLKMSSIDYYDFPLSHSLVMTLAWATVWALVYFLVENDSKGSWIVAGLVTSNWFLDLITHRADLPIFPAETGYAFHKYGWGLWASPIGTILVEGALFILGFYIYRSCTKAADRIGDIALWIFVGALLVVYILNFVINLPNNSGVVSTLEMIQILFVIFGFWIDDHRTAIK